MYVGVIDLFGWPVYFARMGGMGCACWTAILYATMSRTVLSWLSIRVPKTEGWLTFFDAHKDLHVLAGKSMAATAAEHIVAHTIGTIPGMLKADMSELNGLLGCANRDTTPGYMTLPFFGSIHQRLADMASMPCDIDT